MDDELKKILAGTEITEHQLKQMTSLINDKVAVFSRQQIAPNPATLIAKLQLCLIEFDVLKKMIFASGSQFEDLAMIHAYSSLELFSAWLDEVNAEATRAKLMAPGPVVPPNRNGN